MGMLKVKVMSVSRTEIRVLLSSHRARTSICAPSRMNFAALARRIEQGLLHGPAQIGPME